MSFIFIAFDPWKVKESPYLRKSCWVKFVSFEISFELCHIVCGGVQILYLKIWKRLTVGDLGKVIAYWVMYVEAPKVKGVNGVFQKIEDVADVVNRCLWENCLILYYECQCNVENGIFTCTVAPHRNLTQKRWQQVTWQFFWKINCGKYFNFPKQFPSV